MALQFKVIFTPNI